MTNNKQHIINVVIFISVLLALIHPLFALLAFIIYVAVEALVTRKPPNEHVKPEPVVIPWTNYRIDYPIDCQIKSNQFMSAEEKQIYLQSDKWKSLCRLVKERDNNKCVISGSTSNLEIHHLHYLNLGAERLEDLITLSRECHQLQHDYYGYDRNTTYLPLIHP